MKTPLPVIILLAGIACYCPSVNAQSAWSSAAPLGHGATPRYNACAMSIGSKGYIGTGFYNSNFYSDFFEFDGTSNIWSQKAFFTGGNRSGATAFSIGLKGYIGLGYDGLNYKDDFWEYDQAGETWTQKATFPGTARSGAVGFAIGTKGYAGTGYTGTVRKNDFWEYEPATNTWTQKANFGGVGRSAAAGFAIGTKGYLGTGYDGTNRKTDFWEFDQASNTWTQKAAFGGSARSNSVSFAIGTKGYIGTGLDGTYKNDFWEYNPATNTWTSKATFGGAGRYNAAGFSIGTKGYIGTGFDGITARYDFWEYDQTTNTWLQKSAFGGFARTGAVSFTLNNKGYVGTGYDGNNYTNDFWLFDPSNNQWTQKASCPGSGRTGAVGFAINSKGYMGTGYNGTYLNDFWEYDPVANSWTSKANFGGAGRAEAAGMVINAKGYIGTGTSGNSKSDMWEFDPVANTWMQKNDFPGGNRQEACAFSVNSKGYLATGVDNSESFYDDLWEFDPAANTWLQIADFPAGTRKGAAAITFNNKGYVCAGIDQQGLNQRDFWEFNPATGGWTRKSDYMGTARNSSIMFTTESTIWSGFGDDGSIYKNDLWKFNPANSITLPGPGFCAGSSFIITFTDANYAFAGNVYTAQLSNESGSFSVPATIGTLGSTASGTMPVTLPQGLVAGTNYKIRILSSNPVQTLDTSSSFSVYTAPTIISCPPPVTANTDLNLCSATVSFGAGQASGIPAPVFSFSPASGSTFATGATNVTATASNTCGTANCSFIVTINDNQSPGIICPSPVTINAGSGLCSVTGVNLGTPVTTDNCGIAGFLNNAPSTFQVGTTNVVWKVNDINGNMGQCLQTVTVVDNQPPVISNCPNNISGCSSIVSWVPPVAADNCGVASLTSNKSPGSSFPNGITNVTYTATDVNGNFTTCSFTVTVAAPVYTVTPTGSSAFCIPGGVKMTVSPAGDAYQWYKNNVVISGATKATFTSKGTGSYFCKVTSSTCGINNSNTLTTTGIAKPAAVISPFGNVTICSGQTITLAANTGTGLTYKWKKGSAVIAGATNSTYTASQAGTYQVIVTNSAGCSNTSVTAVVKIGCKEFINAAGKINLNVFPNPSDGYFYAAISTDASTPSTIQVADLLGRVIFREVVNDCTEIAIDLRGNPSGIYFVSLQSNETRIVKKIEVTH